jgi:hypothetical protein
VGKKKSIKAMIDQIAAGEELERAERAAELEHVTEVKVPVGEKIELQVFAFPTRVRCTRCGSLSTRRYASKGRKQYRKCTRAVCREKFTVIGSPV